MSKTALDLLTSQSHELATSFALQSLPSLLQRLALGLRESVFLAFMSTAIRNDYL